MKCISTVRQHIIGISLQDGGGSSSYSELQPLGGGLGGKHVTLPALHISGYRSGHVLFTDWQPEPADACSIIICESHGLAAEVSRCMLNHEVCPCWSPKVHN